MIKITGIIRFSLGRLSLDTCLNGSRRVKDWTPNEAKFFVKLIA